MSLHLCPRVSSLHQASGPPWPHRRTPDLHARVPPAQCLAFLQTLPECAKHLGARRSCLRSASLPSRRPLLCSWPWVGSWQLCLWQQGCHTTLPRLRSRCARRWAVIVRAISWGGAAGGALIAEGWLARHIPCHIRSRAPSLASHTCFHICPLAHSFPHRPIQLIPPSAPGTLTYTPPHTPSRGRGMLSRPRLAQRPTPRTGQTCRACGARTAWRWWWPHGMRASGPRPPPGLWSLCAGGWPSGRGWPPGKWSLCAGGWPLGCGWPPGEWSLCAGGWPSGRGWRVWVCMVHG